MPVGRVQPLIGRSPDGGPPPRCGPPPERRSAAGEAARYRILAMIFIFFRPERARRRPGRRGDPGLPSGASPVRACARATDWSGGGGGAFAVSDDFDGRLSPAARPRPGEAWCRTAWPHRGLQAIFYLFFGAPFHPRREVSGGAASHCCEWRSGAPSGFGQGPATWPARRRARGRRRRGRAFRPPPGGARRCPARQVIGGGESPGRAGQPLLPGDDQERLGAGARGGEDLRALDDYCGQ
jgi:hypothetical protein